MRAPVTPSDAGTSGGSPNGSSSTPYHVWVRLRATNDSKFNDSMWVQFSDALDSSARPVYPIGSTSGLLPFVTGATGVF